MPRTEAGQRNILEKFSHFLPFFLSANGIYGIIRKIPRPAARAQNGGLHGEGSERTFHSDKRGRESGMGITEEALWKVLEQKAEEEDEHSASGQKIAHEYLAGIKAVCTFGVDRSKMIRDQFPMYTLHDEVHICNVLRIMDNLLGDQTGSLSRDEAAMLILAACCHDVGMSCSEEEKAELLDNTDRLARYLERNHSEYIKAYAENPDEPKLTDGMLQRYLRSIHHERSQELLEGIEWPQVLVGKVDVDDLFRVCRSHGESVFDLNGLESTPSADLRFCAVLLRLADILDFDTSRAPKAVYDYSGLDRPEGSEAKISREEWQKHIASQGFDFAHIPDRQVPYDLPYHAKCASMQIEQTVNSYLDWADRELSECSRLLRSYGEKKWKDFVLPGKIKRTIKADGYVSGQYHLTMDQDQIMELLVGEELYSDPSVFVRELIQNAIDAVRTRQQLDRNLPGNWKPQVNIRSWMDEEGYHWFRIEDNGTGMTKEIIENHFLKIGSSYYASDAFEKEKIRCKADPDYTPISRFGIGILSCFMGGEDSNRVEVSTKRFRTDGNYPPALRLSMHGMSGYYYLASQEEGHCPAPMKGITDAEKRKYLQKPGTAIAVRTNLYQTGKYTGFKEIVDRYVIYPPVPIHYDGAEGSFDYATKDEFMEAVHAIHPSDNLAEQGVLEFPMTEEQCRQVAQELPGVVFDVPPKVVLKCAPLDRYTESPYLSGAVLLARVEGKCDALKLKFGEETVKADVKIVLDTNDTKDALSIKISLDFSLQFQQAMDVLKRKFGYRKGFSLDMYKELMGLCEGDWQQEKIQEEIIRAIEYQYIVNSDWKRRMCRKWSDLSMKSLNKKIAEIGQKYQEITGETLPNENEQKKYQEYTKYNRHVEFTVCKLYELPWYHRYFGKIFDRTQLYGVAAHNGILCGDSKFFYSPAWREAELGTIILLQDRYRPGVDVARLGIRELSLEMSCDFELIRRCFVREGFTFLHTESAFLKDKPPMIPEAMYSSLLMKRPDLEQQLIFDTDKGDCGCDALEELIAEHKQLTLQNTPSHTDECGQLLYQLQITYLKQNYGLCMTRDSFFGNICIRKKGKEPIEKTAHIFPPALFLHTNKKYKYLRRKSSYVHSSCNAEHSLSQFMLKNGELLHQKVPGILKELIRILQKEDGDEVVQKVNNLLACLRNLPGQPITVPDDVFLTEDDLF